MGKDMDTNKLDLSDLPFMRTLSPWNEGNLQTAQGKSEDAAAQGNSEDLTGENNTKETMDEPQEEVRQNSAYGRGNRPRVDNNNFFEERSNPLSSKGD